MCVDEFISIIYISKELKIIVNQLQKFILNKKKIRKIKNL